MLKSFTFHIFLVFLTHFIQTSQSFLNTLETSKKDLQINIKETDSFQLFLKNPTNESINVWLNCVENCTIFSPIKKSFIFTTNTSLTTINITGISAGHDIIVASTNLTQIIDDGQSFVRIRIGHNNILVIVSLIVGWIYFIVWSLSFWPQNITNYRRKSVIGLNIDFAALNLTGFIFYTIFNSGLYYSSLVQSLYEKQFPRSEIPVELNDVIYSIHAAIVTGITVVQCFIYDRGGQKISIYAKGFLWITWSAAFIQLFLCIFHVQSWLTFLLYFSYVKLIVTCVKYAPQAWFNYKRKSTDGWTIYMIYLDISGGIFGLLQMVFIAYNYNDWLTIFGNFAKFGLSIASICYDILFLLQEFVFYPKNKRQLIEEEEKIDY